MNIVQIATEYAPFIKVGGLGDVTHGISQELARQGLTVTCLLPYHPSLPSKLSNLKQIDKKLILHENNHWHNNTIWESKVKKVRLIFIEPHHPHSFFSRKNIYGYDDDVTRFIYFSRIAMEYLLEENKIIDVLHLHDWHSSLCAVIYKDVLKQHNLSIKKIILTVHNFHYQGKCSIRDLQNIGLNNDQYLTPEKLQDNDPKYPQTINLLKGGIIYADAVTTVSPTHAKEVIEKEGAFGLESTLKSCQNKLYGILNGLDEDEWNPEKDPHIFFHFSKKDSIDSLKQAKKKNKQQLQSNLSLDIDPDKCLVISIGRIVHQKGPELIEATIRTVLNEGGQFILCGSANDLNLQEHFQKLQSFYKDNHNVHFHFEYDESFTRIMFASSDFIIIPSRFEPCGLTQLIAMRYGSVPIVRKTGGLADTVFDVEDTNTLEENRNGYVFSQYNEKECIQTVQRAMKDYKAAKTNKLSHNILKLDFSWKVPVKKYLQIF